MVSADKLRRLLAFAAGFVALAGFAGMIVCVEVPAVASVKPGALTDPNALTDGVWLQPPGWDCAELEKTCWPLEGYRFEDNKKLGVIAVHDGVPSWKVRQEDIDTASGWRLLNNTQRRAILDGKATIYDFVVFEESI